ncbi:hypothetical protein DCO58_03265 [Helicobacter saguini]|uniref:Uncharacterized protein n=1 Tax=Helicobacter saguini TaxID=1548018 RepID=A0A6B0HJX2_9HELI|nr:hypothetical protein [Helicobacter saguini]MWV62610.1 hypothetical protein [Helicobacter saguini]MWV66718.1 hypothetical protein [Helicobacter saguini]MWV69068.1 hypothetical protein [Helicobacter saguini]MWV71378.1 hypothetical protein [Helicobacter saguini]
MARIDSIHSKGGGWAIGLRKTESRFYLSVLQNLKLIFKYFYLFPPCHPLRMKNIYRI